MVRVTWPELLWLCPRNFSKELLPKDSARELESIRKRCQNTSEILYGIQPVLAALSINQRSPFKLFVKDDLIRLSPPDLIAKNPWLAHILELAETRACPVVPASQEFLTQLTHGRSNQGVAFECSTFPTPPLKTVSGLLHFPHCKFSLARHARCCGSSGIILLLDQLQDVMNLGSILRSAVFFGVPTVLVSAYGSAMPSPLISKLSAGAMETVHFYRIFDLKETLKMLSADAGFLVVGTAGREVGGLFNRSDFRPPLELSSVKPAMVSCVH